VLCRESTSFCSIRAGDCRIGTLVSHSTSSSSWPLPLLSWTETGHRMRLQGLRLFQTRFFRTRLSPISSLWVSRRLMPDAWLHTNRFWIHSFPFIGPSRPPPYFKSTEDLLSKFQLLSAYDSYVRPFLPPDDMSPDKGKGKQRDMSPIPQPHSVHINDQDDDELDRRKTKNSYKHLIKGIPGSMTLCIQFQPALLLTRPTGKHSTKKDDFLTTIMQVPPKQRINIVPFDSVTQRDAFSVGLDGLKGVGLMTTSIQSSYQH